MVESDDNPASRGPIKLDTKEWKVSALRCCGGGGTGREFVKNLQDPEDNYWNKWYDASGSPTWIQADFNSPIIARGFSIKSANDCEHRDPYKIEVLVTYENQTEMVSVGIFDELKFEQRYESQYFDIYCESKITSLRISILENLSFKNNKTFSDGIQLGEFVVYY